MGLTCSLLGHARDTPETEREREERGDEVVVVTREVRECTRCGDRTVVSENTEVRPVREPGDPGGTPDAPGQDDDTDSEGADATVAPEPEPSTENGGIILEDDGDSDRAPGEWPSTDEDGGEPAEPSVAEAAEAAEAGDAPGTEEAGATPDDAAESGQVADVTGREWPDDGPEQDPTPEGTGIAAAERVEAPDTGETAFVCPECEFLEPARGSSHREGDICPDCRKGYLAARTRN